MTPADFQSEYASNTGLTQSARPALHTVHMDRPASQANAGDQTNKAGATRQQSGFLNPSIDEIARLYVESPFSW